MCSREVLEKESKSPWQAYLERRKQKRKEKKQERRQQIERQKKLVRNTHQKKTIGWLNGVVVRPVGSLSTRTKERKATTTSSEPNRRSQKRPEYTRLVANGACSPGWTSLCVCVVCVLCVCCSFPLLELWTRPTFRASRPLREILKAMNTTKRCEGCSPEKRPGPPHSLSASHAMQEGRHFSLRGRISRLRDKGGVEASTKAQKKAKKKKTAESQIQLQTDFKVSQTQERRTHSQVLDVCWWSECMQMDLSDPRIARVFENPDFAIDPTNPRFRVRKHPTQASSYPSLLIYLSSLVYTEHGSRSSAAGAAKSAQEEDGQQGKAREGSASNQAPAAPQGPEETTCS